MLDDQVRLPVCFSRPRSSPGGGCKSIEYRPVTMTPTPSQAQIRFVFSPSPALLAMIPQATPVPQFPFLVDFTAYPSYVHVA